MITMFMELKKLSNKKQVLDYFKGLGFNNAAEMSEDAHVGCYVYTGKDLPKLPKIEGKGNLTFQFVEKEISFLSVINGRDYMKPVKAKVLIENDSAKGTCSELQLAYISEKNFQVATQMLAMMSNAPKEKSKTSVVEFKREIRAIANQPSEYHGNDGLQAIQTILDEYSDLSCTMKTEIQKVLNDSGNYPGTDAYMAIQQILDEDIVGEVPLVSGKSQKEIDDYLEDRGKAIEYKKPTLDTTGQFLIQILKNDLLDSEEEKIGESKFKKLEDDITNYIKELKQSNSIISLSIIGMIIDFPDSLLAENKINIPDPERDDENVPKEEQSAIYGDTYFYYEEVVATLLKELGFKLDDEVDDDYGEGDLQSLVFFSMEPTALIIVADFAKERGLVPHIITGRKQRQSGVVEQSTMSFHMEGKHAMAFFLPGSIQCVHSGNPCFKCGYLAMVSKTADMTLVSTTAAPVSFPRKQHNPPSMFPLNLQKLTLDNELFRKVLYTGDNMQLVLMSLQPNEEIGEETHESVDQFFRVEKGIGELVFPRVSTSTSTSRKPITAESAFIVPAGKRHNVINKSSTETLQLYTIYAPPNHPFDAAFKTKADSLVKPVSKTADMIGNFQVNLLNPKKDDWVSAMTHFLFDDSVKQAFAWYKDAQSRSDMLFTLIHSIDGLLNKGDSLSNHKFVFEGDRYNFTLKYRKELLYSASKDKGIRPFGRDWINLVSDVLINLANELDYGSIPVMQVLDAMIQMASERGIVMKVK